MTDRELLELAAKAAGIKCRWWKVKQWKERDSPHGKCKYCIGSKSIFGTHHSKEWNPLSDDGDALRLSVKAQIEYAYGTVNDQIVCVMNFVTDTTYVEDCGGDVCATVRRAIVLAAAEIGRAM